MLYEVITVAMFFSGPEYLAFALGAEPVSYLADDYYDAFVCRITSYNVCYTKLLRRREVRDRQEQLGRQLDDGLGGGGRGQQ